MLFRLLLLCAGALALLSGCGGATGSDGGTGGGGTGACLGTTARTLDAVFTGYFAAGTTSSCLTSGCHASGSGGLTFDSAATFHAATVNKPAASDASKTLVRPFDPEGSWLYQKLLPSAPSQMPVGGTPLDQAGLDAVKGWICAGAQAGTGGGGGAGAVSVTQLSPSSGYVGTTVTVTGAGFGTTLAGNAVKFNGAAAVVTSATRTSLIATVPAGATTGPVTVAAGGQTATSPSSFTVLTGNPVPVVTALSPCGRVAGAGAFTLTIDGQNFLPGTTVTFGGTAVAATFVSASQLTAAIPAALVATAPAGNAAPVVLTNPGPGGGASQTSDFGIASAFSTLAAQVQPIFTANCTGAGCHNATSLAGGLNLSAGASRAALVGAFSTQCTSEQLVRARSPSRAPSVLLDKVLATGPSPPCSGTPMPKGAPLSAAEKQRLVDWVAQGAP